MRYKAIFIDIDDTILDYIPCCREAFDAAMSKLNDTMSVAQPLNDDASLNDELFELFFGISGRLFSEAKHGLHTVAEVMELYPREFIERMNEIRSKGVKERRSEEVKELRSEEVEAMTDVFKHAFRAAWGQTHTLVPGAKETLKALHDKGYRLFAASNSFGHLQRSRLSHAGLLDLFEDTYISMDIGFDKPDIRFYEIALNRCGLSAGEVLMVGDSMTTDILGAQKAGLDTCFFARTEGAPTEPANYTIHRLEELLMYV